MVRCLALATGLCAVSAPAFAYDDGYQNVFSSVLTAVGVLKAEKSPEIEYRERPSLVLPPKMDLAKPAGTAARPTSWPKDPDVIKARKANENARAPEQDVFAKTDDKSLSMDERMKGRAEAGEDVRAPGMCGGFHRNDAACRVSPDVLRAQNEQYLAANPTAKNEVTAGVEPDRLYLTQPPKGYLKPTKTVKATVEAPVPKLDDSNVKNDLMYKQKPDE